MKSNINDANERSNIVLAIWICAVIVTRIMFQHVHVVLLDEIVLRLYVWLHFIEILCYIKLYERLVFDIIFSILVLSFDREIQCTFHNTIIFERMLRTRWRKTVRDNERTLNNLLKKMRESNFYCLQVQCLKLR